LSVKTNTILYNLIKNHTKNTFGSLPSYQQFCAGLESNLVYLSLINYVITEINKQKNNDFFIIDSTSLPICRNSYRSRSKLGKNIATSGKNINGWYFGFKLRLVITNDMDIISFKFTGGSTSGIAALDTSFVKNITGYLIGDKGYLGKKKAQELRKNGIKLITKPRKNMKQIPTSKNILKMLCRRQVVETSFSLLKSKFSLIFQHARSLNSFFSQALSAIFSYHLHRKSPEYYLENNIFSLGVIS